MDGFVFFRLSYFDYSDLQLFAIFIFEADFSETYVMTSAENSVSEPPNLKNFWEETPRPPYKVPHPRTKNLATALLWVRKLVAVKNNVSRGNCCPYLFERSVIIFLGHQSVSCSVAK